MYSSNRGLHSGANRGANGFFSLTTQVCSIQHLIQHRLGASLDSTEGGGTGGV
jgi:hypothetical protein